MKRISREIASLSFGILFAGLLAGCGGGGGGGFAGPAAVFDLGTAQSNVYNGANFSLTGSDNRGSNYTATMSFANQGNQVVNGVNTTHIRLDLSLTNTTTNGTTSGTQDLYLAADYTPVLQLENPGNIQYTPTSVTPLPANASIGDSGPFASFSKSNGETEVDTWSLDAAANGRARLSFHVTTRDAANALIEQETDAFTIDTAGVVYSITSQLTDPSGAVLTLAGNKQ